MPERPSWHTTQVQTRSAARVVFALAVAGAAIGAIIVWLQGGYRGSIGIPPTGREIVQDSALGPPPAPREMRRTDSAARRPHEEY